MSQEEDEVLYMKRIEVQLELLRSPANNLLSNQALVKLVEVIYTFTKKKKSLSVFLGLCLYLFFCPLRLPPPFFIFWRRALKRGKAGGRGDAGKEFT